MHERVRKELWGYTYGEHLDAAELHKIKYQVMKCYKMFYSSCKDIKIFQRIKLEMVFFSFRAVKI